MSAPGLSAERIVASAIELADEDGLEGLSIRKLALRLNAGTMAAYRHVESREALIALMVDTALGDPPADSRTGSWRARVTDLALALFARYSRHPWLVDAPTDGLTVTPHRARWLERLLAALQGSGLDLADVLKSALLIDSHLRSVAGLAHSVSATTAEEPPPLDGSEFPVLEAVLASGAFTPENAVDPVFGLERILDGIDALARRSSA